MKNEYSAEKPLEEPCPILCRTSDDEFDFGAPVLADHRALDDRRRSQVDDQERGLRADVYRSLGLM